MCPHRMADDVAPRRFGQAGQARERQRQRVGVLHTGAHVVVVLAVARRRPGIAVGDQVGADRGVAHRQRHIGPAVAVGVHHEAAVPVLGHLDAVARPVEHALEARGRGPRQGLESQRGLVQRKGPCVVGARLFRLGRAVTPTTSARHQQHGAAQGSGPLGTRKLHVCLLLISALQNARTCKIAIRLWRLGASLLSPTRQGSPRDYTGTAVVFLTRSSTKLVLQSSTLGCLSSVSMMKRE